jgi:Amt family ammonium transporter
MTGGMAALVGAYMLGPRVGRFRDGQAIEMPQLSFVYQTLGTLCLWFGWYGFNGVSSLYIIGKGEVAARAMVNTTIAAACGCVSSVVMSKFMVGYINPEAANNGILGGLVAITAGCAVVNPEGAIAIGLIAGVIYNASSSLLLRLQIDDVVDAAPVHYFCGIWGVLSAALFATKSGYANAYYPDRSDQCCGAFYGCGGDQFAANLAFVVANSAWTGVLSFFMYLTAKYTVGLRVSAEVEEIGKTVLCH